MSKKVTMVDIANKLQISKATVSKALSGATDVNEQTREKVLSCASELGYYVKFDRVPRDKNILIFIYGVQYGNVNQFGYEIILGLQAAANEINWGVKIVEINDDELFSGKYYKYLLDFSCEGCYFIGFRPHEAFVEAVANEKLPLIVLDNFTDSPFVARIGSDGKYGIKLIVNHLLALGHRNIGFLGGEEDSIVTIEREEAFRSTLAENGVSVPDVNVRYGHFSGHKIKRSVLALARENVTAIVCVSDIIACSAIRILQENGISVPDDISVTGFDNLPEATYFIPSLTTVSQNRIHIGKTAFFMLDLMKNEIKIEEILLRPELVTRNSVKKII